LEENYKKFSLELLKNLANALDSIKNLIANKIDEKELDETTKI